MELFRARCSATVAGGDGLSHRTGCARRGAGVRRQRGVRLPAVGRGQPAEGDGRLVPTTLRLVPPTGLGPRRAGCPEGDGSRRRIPYPAGESGRVAGSGLHAVFRRPARHRPPTSGSPNGAARLGTLPAGPGRSAGRVRPRCRIGDYLQSE